MWFLECDGDLLEGILTYSRCHGENADTIQERDYGYGQAQLISWEGREQTQILVRPYQAHK